MTPRDAIVALVVLFVGSVVLLGWLLVRDALRAWRQPDEAQRIDDHDEEQP